jgi:membrane associated rhomboid family serine protease
MASSGTNYSDPIRIDDPPLPVEFRTKAPESSTVKSSNSFMEKATGHLRPSKSKEAKSLQKTSAGTGSSNSSLGEPTDRKYTVSELINSLDNDSATLPPALERRVRDFKMAQQKRREKQGEARPWGIFGLYAHLSDIRADLEWAEDAAWRRQKRQPYLSWSDFEETRTKGNLNRPWFTYSVIFVCTVMVVVTWGVNGWVFEPLNVNPLIGPSSDTLTKCGARSTNLIVNESEWFRLFTPIVLHAGLIHYVINMAATYYIGGAVELSHGHASAAALFVIPAVGGNILSAICLPQYISVGASGGIFGLIGACAADISLNWNLLFLKSTTNKKDRWRHTMVLFWLGVDMLINCIIGFTPFVDNFTHLGGFLYGLLCGLSTIEQLGISFFGLSNGASKFQVVWHTFIRYFGLIISVFGIMVTTGLLADSDGITSPCHNCRYISCVPFPPGDDKWWHCDDCDTVEADLFVSSNGSGLYTEIDVTCPDGSIKDIYIAQDNIYDKSEMRRSLPDYCRKNCDSVFAEN